ncbi:phosphoenolpyruvate carboxylase [Xanthomonas campestris]|jgi:phosphoenolpyruvate carboxylase|uniref:Phosphoenolpyruvate carboxylase n=1 Tax=Xanthomonas campestris pv. campestris (strain ATCC 33913 / DSM 3586 / NCPPB 528 / LMG 568 / P 25) TaxID=190485 RepID=CAPP_XANCP|nr:phosphoenolpyruvate carboxylase [Xanthomonas campestris]Q8P336.1 RecName: Full=Phosphoenolpyruvate carboxylase; Short=PEPC; Short=PEPCase [Xanthomonas campestris pv. campestris str. ATCC 33913]AAM40069.1 phosphoenolpyruvate carboxylase [Xanthomonas campestris pv. campestris str. ATCC 33913]MCC5052261.1 phosphoenolpyruvate carboxylase [Xanthomonas campestris pv. aberrans]MCC5075555.1 phosphoenolpyruvate carboxylase [Xanthomonas campestris pv. campestris]MCF8798780.1 phosphoenolpyruvate carbo
MNEYRSSLVFATPDVPLRDDVRRLGALVGDLLAEQVSADFLEEIERIRTTAIARRESDTPPAGLLSLLEGREPRAAEALVRAFSTYFQVVNIAERVHRIRRRRDYQRSGTDTPQPEGLHDALRRLKAQGVTLDELSEWLPRIDVEPVFTAHPTEAVRRALLEKEQLMVASLVDNLDGMRTPNERATDAARFRMALTASWQTADSSPVRPTVEDEREHVGFYLTQVLYRVIPVMYETLEHAIEETYGSTLALPRLLRFGTWVGGDMDGNPNVDAHTIAGTLDAQRRAVLDRYLNELWQLASLLSQSTTLVAVSPALSAQLERYQALLPDAAARSRPRHGDMPYRLLNDLMRARLQATLDDADGAYAAPAELEHDLQLILDSLEVNKGLHAGWFAVRRLLWRVRSFGFHLARLDVRQESSVHARAVADALGQADWDSQDATHRAGLLGPYASGEQALPQVDDEGNARLDAVFAALADARTRHGADALGSYIISMAHNRADVLTVLALARRGGLVDDAGAVPLDIVPLFETVDDLRGGTGTVQDLLADPVYRQHLRARGDTQMVMLGYSDSGKDGGIAASRWGLQRAQVELLEAAAELGVRLTFFHGRGGSIVRGGGKTTRALDAAPRGSVDGRLRVTEQGEVIHRKYGIRALALRSLEQMTGAVLLSSLRPRAPEPREDAWRPVMDLVAERSTVAYRGFVGAPDFMQYFRLATPIDVIERMTLGSRPSRRLGQDAALSNLRAIPWVFAWSQARAVIPGWYGVGSGLQAAVEAGHEDSLREMAQDWPFFRTFLDDIAMVLSKGDLNIAELFSRLAGPLHARFFPRIRDELALTKHWVKTLLGQRSLLQHDPRLALSIRLRNPYIDPISVLQVDLLQRWRATDGEDEELLRALVACVNGVAQGVQNTG